MQDFAGHAAMPTFRPMEHEEASDHEELVSEIEPQAVQILLLIYSVLRLESSLQEVIKTTAWWSLISGLEISDVECKKSAYLRALRPVLTLLKSQWL